MNEAPENKIISGEVTFPEGSENWSLNKKQDFIKGGNEEPEITQGPENPDLLDVPGEKIEYPIPAPEPVMILHKEDVPLKVLPSEIKERAIKWHTEQDGVTRLGVLEVLAEIGSVEEIKTVPRRGELISRFSSNIKKETGGEILARLRGEDIPEKKPETNFDFTQNKISRGGFAPALVLNQPEVPEKISDNPSGLIYEVKAGDSLWEILKNKFWENELFTTLTKAQKIYVLNKITGIIFKTPEEFGLDGDGSLRVGNKIDLTTLSIREEEIKEIIEEAQKVITIGSAKEKQTLNLDTSEWEKEHVPEPISKIEPEPATQLVKPEPIAAVNSVDKYRAERDDYATRRAIAEAQGKQKLAEFEAKEARNPSLERSLRSDIEEIKKVNESTPKLEEALNKDVNHFFTKGLLFKTEGIKSDEWNFMRRLSFSKLVKYYTGDSNSSGLAPEAIEELKKSDKYREFWKHVVDLKGQTGDVILFKEDDSIENVLRKVGERLLKSSPVELKQAA